MNDLSTAPVVTDVIPPISADLEILRILTDQEGAISKMALRQRCKCSTDDAFESALQRLITAGDVLASGGRFPFLRSRPAIEEIQPEPAPAPLTAPTISSAPPTPQEELPVKEASPPPPLRKFRKPGRRTPAEIEEAVLAAIATGTVTNKAIAEQTGLVSSVIWSCLKRLQKAGKVKRQGGKRGAWSPAVATNGPASPAKKGKASGTARRPAAEKDPGLAELLGRFTQRLQPPARVGEKVAVLNQLATVVPTQLSRVLVEISEDLVRMAGG